MDPASAHASITTSSFHSPSGGLEKAVTPFQHWINTIKGLSPQVILIGTFQLWGIHNCLWGKLKQSGEVPLPHCLWTPYGKVPVFEPVSPYPYVDRNAFGWLKAFPKISRQILALVEPREMLGLPSSCSSNPSCTSIWKSPSSTLRFPDGIKLPKALAVSLMSDLTLVPRGEEARGR